MCIVQKAGLPRTPKGAYGKAESKRIERLNGYKFMLLYDLSLELKARLVAAEAL